jgi:hypothetical protein
MDVGISPNSGNLPFTEAIFKVKTLQVHSCRSEDALAQKRCEIKAEGRGDGSKKMAENR